MSQSDAILEALKAGDRLTALEALERFGTLRLAARVAELREQGHPIESEPVRLPNGKHVVRYHLEARHG